MIVMANAKGCEAVPELDGNVNAGGRVSLI